MERIVKPLLGWFLENKRDLPWRHNPTPYLIYVSEIMLQQTRVEAVKPYYFRFLEVLPDFESLANASDEVLFKLWEGLGYYSRVKNMRKCAQAIMVAHQGEFPKTYKEAMALPGIGMYTAGAILSRSYGVRAAAVDGNVLRVFSRLYEDDSDILKDTTKKEYKEKIEQILPDNPGTFNEALMELGATVCMPKVALCDACPLRELCQSRFHGTVYSYPRKKAKPEKKSFEYSVLFVTDGLRYIFLPKKDGVLSGLPSPFLVDYYMNTNEIREYMDTEYGLSVMDALPFSEDTHIFSHQIWYMRAYKVFVRDLKDYTAYTEDEIKEKVGLPTAYRKFLKDLF